MPRTVFAALAAALAAIALPVAAQEQNSYEAGVAARQAGKPAEAKGLLREWLRTHPDDVDAVLQLAYADLALGNLAAAEESFADVLRRAPGYADAREGLAAVAARRSDPAQKVDGFVLVEGALSTLSGGASDWGEGAAEIELPAGAASVGARGAWYRRFGFEDIELTGRIGLHPSRNVWLRAHVAGTPKADFRPKLEVGGGFDVRLGDGSSTVVSFDSAWQRFPAQAVVTLNPAIVQYFAQGRGWVTVRGIGTVADGGALEVGALLRGDYVPREGWRVFGGASNGPDTDLGIVTRVTGLFGGVEVPLGGRVGAIGSVARDWRAGGFNRTEFRLGLKAKF